MLNTMELRNFPFNDLTLFAHPTEAGETVEFKGKSDEQIAYCDALKKTLVGLEAYVKEHHLSGLSWNPRGVELTDAVVADVAAAAAPAPAAVPAKAAGGGGGGMVNIMAELAKKKTQDGSSAATGLKKVTKDMQTWRTEFKGGEPAKPAVPPVEMGAVSDSQ